tara:strand:+ start:437 stop:757 length:321 start_codon:yes stop_codon:yes gene_type:complete
LKVLLNEYKKYSFTLNKNQKSNLVLARLAALAALLRFLMLLTSVLLSSLLSLLLVVLLHGALLASVLAKSVLNECHYILPEDNFFKRAGKIFQLSLPKYLILVRFF